MVRQACTEPVEVLTTNGFGELLDTFQKSRLGKGERLISLHFMFIG